jgi:hypothetical protein
MTRHNRPPKDFDIPKLHFVEPDKYSHVLPKSTDPEEIAFRQKNPGLDRLRKQHIGLYIAGKLVNWPFQQEESRTYVNNIVAINLLNTSAYAFEEEQRAGMRNKLKLPELAAAIDDGVWYESKAGLYSLINDHLSIADVASNNWMLAHQSDAESRRLQSAVTFARSAGNAALKLISLGLTDDTESPAYTMQKNAQTLATQLLDQAREAYLINGVSPSLKHMAVDPLDKIFPRPKTDEAMDALVQLRSELKDDQ